MVINFNEYHNTQVKLNNPLMGTETPLSPFYISLCIITLVKLNNPLMGTETINKTWNSRCWVMSIRVKLNNPLMGTETV